MTNIGYPTLSPSLSFADYLNQCKQLIQNRRPPFPLGNIPKEKIESANAPYELSPEQPIYSGNRLKYGALLLHGLLDCPYSLREIGDCLQKKGILCRSILLPGHGTMPTDLFHVSYHDWIHAVQYGIESLINEVDHLFLIGYSTGASLSLYHAFHKQELAGLILLSPAIRIKTPILLAAAWRHFLGKWNKSKHHWMIQQEEMDYVKYKSIPLHAVQQVNALTHLIDKMQTHYSLTAPILSIMSQDDETISSESMIRYLLKFPNPMNRLWIYTTKATPSRDHRLFFRSATFPALRIRSFSHTAIPFSSLNPHYGSQGDYPFASHDHTHQLIYGAYNPIETIIYDGLLQLGLAKHTPRELTYNPDFEFMMEKIVEFMLGTEV